MSCTVMKDPKGVVSEVFSQEATGVRWRRKKDKKAAMGVSGRTPGSTKEPCKVSVQDKYFAKYSRAQYHRDYAAWSQSFLEKGG